MSIIAITWKNKGIPNVFQPGNYGGLTARAPIALSDGGSVRFYQPDSDLTILNLDQLVVEDESTIYASNLAVKISNFSYIGLERNNLFNPVNLDATFSNLKSVYFHSESVFFSGDITLNLNSVEDVVNPLTFNADTSFSPFYASNRFALLPLTFGLV